MKHILRMICIIVLVALICGCVSSTKDNVPSTPTLSPPNGTVPRQNDGNGTYAASPIILDVNSTTISASPNPGIEGRNVTVSGQHFTPDGTASIYGLPNEVYTANVDKDGNVSWTFVGKVWYDNYRIYALDGNYTNTKSNTITLNVNPDYYSTPPPPSSSPSIWVSPNPVSMGENLTISGQNFTPGGIAVLYRYPQDNFTASVDKNGNTSWTFTNEGIAPYSVYAMDGNSTGKKSNSITIYPILNDAPPSALPPSPTPALAPTPFPGSPLAVLSIVMAALICLCKKMPQER